MEAYTRYRDDCTAQGISPVTFMEFIRPQLRPSPNTDEPELEDPQSCTIEPEDTADPE